MSPQPPQAPRSPPGTEPGARRAGRAGRRSGYYHNVIISFCFFLSLFFIIIFFSPKSFSVLFLAPPLPGAQLWLYRSVPVLPGDIYLFIYVQRNDDDGDDNNDGDDNKRLAGGLFPFPSCRNRPLAAGTRGTVAPHPRRTPLRPSPAPGQAPGPSSSLPWQVCGGVSSFLRGEKVSGERGSPCPVPRSLASEPRGSPCCLPAKPQLQVGLCRTLLPSHHASPSHLRSIWGVRAAGVAPPGPEQPLPLGERSARFYARLRAPARQRNPWGKHPESPPAALTQLPSPAVTPR